MSDRLMGRSAYEVLGVPPDASEEDLKRAYRRRMRQTHPDLGGDPEVFLLVQEAWAQVATAQLRTEHDRRRRSAPADDDDERVWTSGRPDRRGRAQTWGSSRAARPRARSYGHPGGWSRERYLDLIREWAGRGIELPDPYEPALVRRAPRELRLLLADAIAEEATATALGALGSAFTLWHDVATTSPARSGGRDVGASKIDHVVLGPSGLFAIQSEDYGAPVAVGSRDLLIEGDPAARPMKDLISRTKAVRGWGVRFTAAIIVLPDEHLETDRAMVGRPRRPLRLAVRRSAVAAAVRTGVPGHGGVDAEVLFDWRTRLQRAIRFV